MLVVATPGVSWPYAVCEALLAVAAVALLARLAVTEAHGEEERVVSALAIVGRATVAAVFVQVGAGAAWAAAVSVTGLTALSLLLVAEMLRLGPRQSRVTLSDPRVMSSAADSAATGSSSSVLRGRRDPGNDETASTLVAPDPSIRQ
jgi:hypothetical protein